MSCHVFVFYLSIYLESSINSIIKQKGLNRIYLICLYCLLKWPNYFWQHGTLNSFYYSYLLLQNDPGPEDEFQPPFTSSINVADPEAEDPLTTQDNELLKLCRKRRKDKEETVKLQISEVAIVDQETSFLIRTQGDDKENFNAFVFGPRPDLVELDLHPCLDENKDITVKFTPVAAGQHTIIVTHNKKKVTGCPLVCEVYDPSKVLIIGAEEFVATVGDIVVLHLDTHLAGHAELDVVGLCPQGRDLPIQMTEVPGESNDVTEMKFSPAVTGDYKLSLTYGGVEVPQSPLFFNVVDSENQFSQSMQEAVSDRSQMGQVDELTNDVGGVNHGLVDQEGNNVVVSIVIPPESTVEIHDANVDKAESTNRKRKMTDLEKKIQLAEKNKENLVPYELMQLNNLKEQLVLKQSLNLQEDVAMVKEHRVKAPGGDQVQKKVKQSAAPSDRQLRKKNLESEECPENTHRRSFVDGDSEAVAGGRTESDEAEEDTRDNPTENGTRNQLDEDELAEKYPEHYEEILDFPRRETAIFQSEKEDKIVRKKNPKLIEALRCSINPEKAINMMNISAAGYLELFGVDFESAAKSYSVGDQRKDSYEELLGMVTSPQFIAKLGTLWNKLARFEEEYVEFR